jgi:peroxiredoxin Q/BCP
MGEKNMYGKIIFWIIRSTFLLDSQWNILQEWRSVRATGHAEKILEQLKKNEEA